MNDIIIPISVGGVTFKNPFYVASGPATKTLKQLKRIEETGWAAASIKLSIDPAPYINRKPRYGYFSEYDALGFTAEKRLTFEEGLRLISGAKKELRDLRLFANITYAGDDEDNIRGWVNMAKKFEECGADVIELNMCCPNMSFNVDLTSGSQKTEAKKTGASLGQDPELVGGIVREIKKALRIPLFVKLTPEGGQIAAVARALFAAGADAVGGAGNRLGIPRIDIDDPSRSIIELQKENGMCCLSGAWVKPLALRDTYEIRKVCGPHSFITAAGGVCNWRDAVEMILCGASLVGLCTEILINGYDIVRPMTEGLKGYMDVHGYRHPDDFRGVLAGQIKTAQELTIYDGYAEIINPALYAPCKSACPCHVPVQALVQSVARRDFAGAWKLLTEAGPLQKICPDECDAPCETACVRRRAGEAVGIRRIIRFIMEWGKRQGLQPDVETVCANGRSETTAMNSKSETTPADSSGVRVGESFKTVLPRDVLKRHGYIGPKRVFPGDGEPGIAAEAESCLNCGCGEGCALCKKICCVFAPDISGLDTLSIDRERCVACSMCFNRCPNKNIRMVSI